MNDPFISIAAMIYNVSKWLPACLDSILSQEGDDIQIILIDDGSTDGCSQICDEIAKKDARVEVVHQKNGGISAARNRALATARGKWLIQVDGDDILLPGACDLCRKHADDTFDVLQFDTIPFHDLQEVLPRNQEENTLTDEPTPGTEEKNSIIIEGENLKDYHLQLIDRSIAKNKIPIYNINPAWSKAWNMEFVMRNHLRYDETVHKGEGTLFTFTASYLFKRVKIVTEALYGYRLNPESVMHRFNPHILEDQNTQWLQYFRVISEHGEEENPQIRAALNRRALYLIGNAVNLGIAHKDCPWRKFEQLKWIKELCSLDWVHNAAAYAVENNMATRDQKWIYKKDVLKLLVFYGMIRRKKK